MLARTVLASLLLASTASADILVMKAPNGQLFLTNRGEKSGYKVISRHREFFGSSGLGLRGAPRDSAKFDAAVSDIAARHSLDPYLVKAVIRAESGFNPMATSPKGAMGLMQLMPDTARQHGIGNAYDPVGNITGGVRHLRYLMNRYDGKIDHVLAAYNAGTKPVDRANGIPNYRETQEYVRRVREFHAAYRSNGPIVAPASATTAATSGPSLAEALSKVDLKGKTPDQVYGVPIVLRDAAGRDS